MPGAHVLPRIPVLPPMKCEDHLTFAVPLHDRDRFIEHWRVRGLQPLPAIITQEFPAEHIALVRTPGATKPCEQMIGLTVSEDPASPVNAFCRITDSRGPRGRLQHIAYGVDPTASFEEVRRGLEERGVVFMTPILEHTDQGGAALRQMFVACEVPFGPFVEIIQRTPGSNGQHFQGFSAPQIDVLYRHYNDYSLRLRREQ